MIIRRPEPPPDLLQAEVAVGPDSTILFRLGERCNHACPMCTNTGRAELDLFGRDELMRRLDFIVAQGFRRVMLTGGEPTIHPDFFTLAEALHGRGVAWDLNTHGRSFHRADFAARARRLGLERAIVSLHGHEPMTSGLMSGAPRVAFEQTLAGMAHLVGEGVAVMANLVLSRINLDHLDAWLELLHAHFGEAVEAKIVFPSLASKGREWDAIQLRLEEVEAPVRRARATAARLGVALAWESVPNCITGDPTHDNVGRTGFGETHYLDDARGDVVYPLHVVERALARYHADCVACPAFDRCSGVSELYAERFGVNALVPFPRGAGAWWLGR